jgi:hypothetical protein
MFTYDEHSGAGNTGWPQLNSSEPLRGQNREYVEFTSRAKAETDHLLQTGIATLADPSRFESPEQVQNRFSTPVVIYNGLSWQRDGVVRLAPPSENTRIISISDVSGRNVPFDVDESGTAIFVAKNIPSMGYATYWVRTIAGKSDGTLRYFGRYSAESPRYSITLNRDGTISGIRDKQTNRELVNSKGEVPFNDLLRVEGPEASKVSYPVEASVSVSRGSQMTEVRVHRPRSSFPITKITVYDGLD